MKIRNSGPAVTINALVWAGVMLVTAYMFKEVGGRAMANFVFVAILGWMVTQGLLLNAYKKDAEVED